jgi:phosphoglycolate phosphatase-like HAD superfamily hydrolase
LATTWKTAVESFESILGSASMEQRQAQVVEDFRLLQLQHRVLRHRLPALDVRHVLAALLQRAVQVEDGLGSI